MYTIISILLLLISLILLYVLIGLIKNIYGYFKPVKYTIIPFITPAKVYDTTFQKIPKVIYQTMKTNIVPNDMKDAINSWININPEYEHYFYNDEMCRNFIKDNFHPTVLHAFDNLVPGAFKADLWRYCILYKYGGVYADIDMVAIKPLRKIIAENDTFISVRDRGEKFAIFNAFICSVPEHPYLKAAIEFIINSVRNNFYGINSLHPTGPLALGEAIKSVQNENCKLLINSEVENYVVYNGEKYIKTKYNNYTNNLKSMGVKQRYDELWDERKVYKIPNKKIYNA